MKKKMNNGRVMGAEINLPRYGLRMFNITLQILAAGLGFLFEELP